MADIFFSYARTDQAHILPIVEALRTEGFDVFFDEHTHSGENWILRLDQELTQAKCLLVAVSIKSIQSEYVNAEILQFKEHKNRLIVPIRIEDVGLNLLLKTRMAIDLISWDKSLQHPQWQKLVLHIMAHLKEKRLGAERVQVQQDAELLKRRLQDELALEWQKLQAVADEIEVNRQHQIKLADYAMQRQKMADSIQAIQDEIGRIEADKEKLDAEIARYELALQDEHENAKRLGEQIFKAKEEPKNREAELAEMQRRLKRAQEAVQDCIDKGCDDEIIARAKANTKKLSEEVKKLKQQQNESVDKLAEPTRKLAENQSRIAALESKKSSIKDKQRLVEMELEQWRSLRRELIWKNATK